MKGLIVLQLSCALISICAVPHGQGNIKMDVSIRNEIVVHGNWCGPGHGGSIDKDVPCVDYLDCMCRDHDLCYEAHGYFNCRCDQDLIHALRGLTDPKSVIIQLFFSKNPCLKPGSALKTCTKCVTIWGRSICSPPHPCGFKCGMVPTLSKSNLSGYAC